MGAPFGADLGIPGREWLYWRMVALTEGFIFLGLLFSAIYVQPIWLGILVLVVGTFASGGVWILLVRLHRRRRPRARKIPK